MRWAWPEAQEIAGCVGDGNGFLSSEQDGFVFQLKNTQTELYEQFKIRVVYNDCFSTTEATTTYGESYCNAPYSIPPASNPYWFYSEGNGHVKISHADLLDGWVSGNQGGNKVRTSGDPNKDYILRIYSIVTDAQGNDVEIISQYNFAFYYPYLSSADPESTCYLPEDSQSMAPASPDPPSPPPSPPAPSHPPPLPHAPYAPYPPLAAVYGDGTAGLDASCSVGVPNTISYFSNWGTVYPCEWVFQAYESWTGSPQYPGFMSYGPTNQRYKFEKNFNSQVEDLYRPMFRYEFSNPVRFCSDDSNYIQQGYLDCSSIGVSGPGSIFDADNSGYVNQITWSGEWHMATAQNPPERQVLPDDQKLPCDDWCFRGTYHPGYARCHWYVRFIERSGSEGQFDYGHLLLFPNTRTFVSFPSYSSVQESTYCTL